MTIKRQRKLFFLAFAFFLQSCMPCVTGGELRIEKSYVSNKCGLLNGVYVREIKIDSIVNDIPIKYTTILSANLYRYGSSPNNEPKQLHFDKDCKEVYVWRDENIVDTIKGPIVFNNNAWYSFYSSDSHEETFMFIDTLGKRYFKKTSGKSVLVNY